MFNSDDFLNQQATGPLSTRRDPLPVGDYKAQITKIEARQLDTKDGKRTVMTVTWSLMDTAEIAAAGREGTPTARQDLWLDVKEDGKTLDFDKGKNIDLGRLYEALGLNDGGATPGMLKGQVGTIRIEHNVDKNKPENVFERVAKVTALT